MNNQKKSLVVFITVMLLFTLQSCYKIKEKDSTKGTITCVDTSNAGISGVRYRIYEKQLTYDNPKTFIEGETDQNGKAYFEFKQPESSKWFYYIEIIPSSFPANFRAVPQRGHSNQMLLTTTTYDDPDNPYDNSNDIIIYFYPE